MSIVLLRKINDTVIKTLTTLSTKEDSVSIVSPLIAEQFPEFIKTDHPRLITFIEAYYEWMEQKNKTLYSTFVLQDFSNIDSTITDFVKHFKSQYLDRFPEILAYDATTKSLVNEKTLIKRIKDFYKAKGSEKAYKLLFRILYDASIDGFYYPREDIMKVSSGKWLSNKSIKTSFTNKTDIWDTVNTTIIQKNNVGDIYATAIVKNILKYETNTNTVAEIFVDEINGTFIIDEVLTFNSGTTNEFTENVQSVIDKIYITTDFQDNLEKGSGYKVGDKIEVITVTGGTDAIGEVAEVDGLGGIVSIDMLNSGIGYRDTDSITFNESSFSGTGAGITASIGAVSLYPGYYFGTQGQLSSNKKLFDNDFYQEFSYEIRSELSISAYKDAILDLIHPAGTKFFNMLFMKKTHPIYTKYKTNAQPLEVSTLGHYTPYNWSTTENLRYNSQEVDLYPFGHNPSTPAAAATATIQFNSETNADYDDETFTVTSTDGTEVVYTLDDDTNTNTYGANATNIGIQGVFGAPSKIADLTTAAGNHSSNAHASKITFVETGGVATVTLTQDVAGPNGNNIIATSNATHITVAGFSGGSNIGTADESGNIAHESSVARDAIYWGQVYNDFAGRTGHGDTDSAGMTNPFDITGTGILGGTWDAGTTGPLWYLSRGVFFTAGTAGASAAYEFCEGTTLDFCVGGDFDQNCSYWVIYPHPNIRGIDTIPSGCSFAAVEMRPFFFELKDSSTVGIDTEFSTIIPT